jgi:hypothetical protein
MPFCINSFGKIGFIDPYMDYVDDLEDEELDIDIFVYPECKMIQEQRPS